MPKKIPSAKEARNKIAKEIFASVVIGWSAWMVIVEASDRVWVRLAAKQVRASAKLVHFFNFMFSSASAE